MTRDSRRFLRPEEISRIARLEVRARHIVEGFLSGLHRSPYLGQSVEFVQHREYVPGDDVRRIDWKVWSKTDRYFIKQYEEDTNLRTTLLVDCSESMRFGTGALNKYEYACTVAAAMSYLLLRQQDSVGLTVFDDEIRGRQDTAVLDLDVGSLTTVKVADPLGQFHDAEAVQNVGKFPLVTTHLEHPGQFRHGLRVSSRVTTHHDRPRAGVPTGQLTDQLAAFRVTGRCDGAGVDDTDVG